MAVAVPICLLHKLKFYQMKTLTDENKYVCEPEGTDETINLDHWKRAVLFNFVVYLILSIQSAIALIATFQVWMRTCSGLCNCCAGIFNIVAIIYLYVVRFNSNGKLCAMQYFNSSEIGPPSDNYEKNFVFIDGKFLRSMAIAQTFLFCWYVVTSNMSITKPRKF